MAPLGWLLWIEALGQRDLFRDSCTLPGRIPPFHVADGGHDFVVESYGARLLPDQRNAPPGPATRAIVASRWKKRTANRATAQS